MTTPYIPPAEVRQQPASQRYLNALDIVLRLEGGAQIAPWPAELGGITKYGIIQPTLDRYRRQHGATSAPARVRNLTEDDARRIYYRQYWKATSADTLPEPMATAFFDTAVHAGPAAARSLLRRSGPDVGRFMQARQRRSDSVALARGHPEMVRAWRNRYANLMTMLENAGQPKPRNAIEVLMGDAGSP